MKHATLSIAVVAGLIVCGCTANEEAVRNAPEATNASASTRPDGPGVYESTCAACHRDGVGGAPVTGNPDSWSERSPLWMAVLSEHAIEGYLQMPARGGDPGYTDADVQAAVEHMLLLTFPDRPGD